MAKEFVKTIDQVISKISTYYITSDTVDRYHMIGQMDKVINDINDRMQTLFPQFSDWQAYADWFNAEYADEIAAGTYTPLDGTKYTAFPQRYVDSVITVGAARFYYMSDEEGEVVASDYFREYEKNISAMVRDYLNQVDELYINDQGGYTEFEFIAETTDSEDTQETNPTGVVINGDEFRL